MSSQAGAPMVQRTFLGHPIGLYVLFFTEMWERFSFYGMRALLMLYMVNYFRWSQKDASTIYKVYTSFVYVTPILGGYLADRYLGNKRAVIIGAILMAIGQFMMAFEDYPIFLSALILLIIGNGFFKPNMSTQVGRLYPKNDGRLDGAYTIFYMGINLGAFLAPIVCGWLEKNTVGGYHTGFIAAGIGMVLGLVIYLLGQPLVREIDHSTIVPPAPEQTEQKPAVSALTEAEAAQTPSALGSFANVVPTILMVLGAALVLAGIGGAGTDFILWRIRSPGAESPFELPEILQFWNAVMLAIAGGCLMLIAYVCSQVGGGVRDRVLAILSLGIFVVFFWAAFEQAGNVLNVWADKDTNRYLTRAMPSASIIPEVIEDSPAGDGNKPGSKPGVLERFLNMFRLKPAKAGAKAQTWSEWLTESFNPIPTPWFQSINALAIFLLAPLFAWLWISLDRRKIQPSIPTKMTFGLLFMAASVALMIVAADQQNHATSARLKGNLPNGVALNDAGQLCKVTKKGLEPFHAGRFTISPDGDIKVVGVLADTEAFDIIEATAPPGFQEAVTDLRKKSKEIDGEQVKSVDVKLAEEPPGVDMKYAGIKKSVVSYDPATRLLTAYTPLADKEEKGLLAAAGDPTFRDTVSTLYTDSNVFRVSPWWLFWSYILATLGELCLSPVGLAMVSKLAPARFATMLMGVWLLTSTFGNFAAGAFGEKWGELTPVTYFTAITVVLLVATAVLFALVRIIVRLMHGVK